MDGFREEQKRRFDIFVPAMMRKLSSSESMIASVEHTSSTWSF
jgi:hypothetical protein